MRSAVIGLLQKVQNPAAAEALSWLQNEGVVYSTDLEINSYIYELYFLRLTMANESGVFYEGLQEFVHNLANLQPDKVRINTFSLGRDKEFVVFTDPFFNEIIGILN